MHILNKYLKMHISNGYLKCMKKYTSMIKNKLKEFWQ